MVPSTKLVKPTNAHTKALQNLREFLSEKTCYDILPESYRLIVFDNSLGIKRALTALMTNGVVSAPLYDSTSFRFCGMFTLTDVIHLIQYFYLKTSPNQINSESVSSSSSTASSPSIPMNSSHMLPIISSPDQLQSSLPHPRHPISSEPPSASSSSLDDPYALAAAEVESFPLSRLRDIEQAIDAPPPPTVHVHPDAPLLEACEQLIRTHARRIPLIDQDATTGKDAILCVLTQYRVLKFIAINAQSDVDRLTQSIGSLGVGSYVSSYQSSKKLTDTLSPNPENQDTNHHNNVTTTNTAHSDHDPFHPLATATLQTTVFDVVHMFSERGISAVPIVAENGSVIDMYEAVDIVDLVRSDAYRLLDLTIEEAIARRSPDYCGVTVCSADDSLSNILKYIGERRVHRFVIVDDLITETSQQTEDEDATPLAENRLMNFVGPGGTGGKKVIVKDRLVGILSLSDVMKHLVGNKGKSLQGKSIVGLGIQGEKEEEVDVEEEEEVSLLVESEDNLEEENE
ncbi:hypothetical protein DFH28DRAFT_884391 [Melampsora americana]|nr:hypothetical protein DFH28DRAFT_884391 [Melampsora americana]